MFKQIGSDRVMNQPDVLWPCITFQDIICCCYFPSGCRRWLEGSTRGYTCKKVLIENRFDEDPSIFKSVQVIEEREKSGAEM